MKIIENAEIAKVTWNEFIKDESNKKILRFFHLRPTNSGVTIITTLDDYEMRGIVKHSKKELTDALNAIMNCYPILVSLNDVKKHEKMHELGFAKREKNGERKSSLEEMIQAMMINTMTDDLGLAKALGVQKMRFVASELIFEKGPYRVDIVGFDGNDIYFFELKKGRTLKISQVSDYIKYYNKLKNKNILKELLKTYPINSVENFKSIKGVMVMKHAENSDSRYGWIDEQKRYGVDILFYSHSLSFKKSLCR